MRADAGLVLFLAIAMLALFALWYSVVCRRGVSRAEASIEALTIAQPNFAAVGLPIIQAVIGPAGSVHVALAIAAASVLPSPITLLVLKLGKGRNEDEPLRRKVAVALWRALTKPVVVAPVAGILFSCLGIHLDALTVASLQLIGVSAGGVALFVTGLVLSAQSLRFNATVVIGTIVAVIAQPLLVWCLAQPLPVPAEQARIAILLAAMPSGFFGILFGISYKVRSQAVGSIVIASTMFSMVTLGLTIYWLFPA